MQSEQLFRAFPLLRYYMEDSDDDTPMMTPDMMGARVFEK